MISFDTVREVGLALPDVIEGTAYGARALKLHGRLLACIPTNKSAEPNSVVVRMSLERRAQLLEERPDAFYITDHYAPHPTVLVRLARVTAGDMSRLLREAASFVSSP